MNTSTNLKKGVLALAAVTALAAAAPAWADDCSPRYRRHRHGDRVSISIRSGYHGSFDRYHRGFYRPHSRYARRTVYVVPAQTQAVYYPPSAGYSTVTVNVQNENGSYTPVTLRQEGGTYVGPRGERYLHLPSQEQLKRVYGLE